jgi:hypothetical protein
MLVIRGTKKLRDRVNSAHVVDGEESNTALGDWFANALFWRPQVGLLVNSRTLLPVFMELAPAATLLKRAPTAIEAVLRGHGVEEAFLAAERKAMSKVRIGPTNDRRVVGVMNEVASHGEWFFKGGQHDLEGLSLRMSSLIIGKLDEGSPDRALAAVTGGAESLAKVIAFPGERSAPDPSPRAPAGGDVFQLKITLLDTKPPIWRRVLVDGGSTLDHVHDVIQGRLRLVELPPARVRGRAHALRRSRSGRGLGRAAAR